MTAAIEFSPLGIRTLSHGDQCSGLTLILPIKETCLLYPSTPPPHCINEASTNLGGLSFISFTNKNSELMMALWKKLYKNNHKFNVQGRTQCSFCKDIQAI